MDKQKQVEEVCKMAVMGCRRNPQANRVEECIACEFKCGMCDVYRVAENIYKAGYRKIPENAVVLTREELEEVLVNYVPQRLIDEILKEITGE